jgi:transposase
MYIERVPNRSSPPAILLRESYREGSRVRKRTLANLTHWPPEYVEALRVILKGGTAVHSLEESFEIVRSLPHGHVAAVLGVARRLRLPRVLASRHSRMRDLVVAMIVARVVEPTSKLATARGLCEETAFTTLGEMLGVSDADEEDLYAAMDWLLPRQAAIEAELAGRHLSDGTLVLYDVTSTYFEGRTCPLAKIGYSRDGRKNKLQIAIGLLCDASGCPVAVEVFEGNVADPKTLSSQIAKVRERFGLQRVVFVSDRGLITSARIEEELEPTAGLDWISALRAPSIKKLAEQGQIQPSLFDETDLAEISSPDFPGERLIVCKNPLLAEERARKREDLLRATEAELDKIVGATQRVQRRLKGKDKIGIRVGRVLNRFKVGKHFKMEITDESFSHRRNLDKIESEASLDGIYVIRTSVPDEVLDSEGTVRAYKSLSAVERAFRSMKTVDLKVRPIFHRLPDRVRSHVFLCMLAYYVEWHMRRDLAPVLFDDEDREAAEAQRRSVVQPAQRSPQAQAKAQTHRTIDDLPVHSFRTLLHHLATITKNRVRPKLPGLDEFDRLTTPTEYQQKVFDLLEVPCRL